MGTTFRARNVHLSLEEEAERTFRASAVQEMFEEMGLSTDLDCTYGEIRARVLKPLLEERIENFKPTSKPGLVVVASNFLNHYRSPDDPRGNLRRYKLLLDLCHRAGDLGVIYWC